MKKIYTKNVKTEQKIHAQIFFTILWSWQILDNFDKIFECHLMIFDENRWFIPNVI
jgi:hypothetical protein